MSRRLPFFIRLIKGAPVVLPPAVERIARKLDVFKMIENGLELDTVSFDDEQHPKEAIFVFGDDQVARFRVGDQP
jgi:hypothetical protein